MLPLACGDDGGSGNDGGLDSGPIIDGSADTDAAVVDCSADYAERGEMQNDVIVNTKGVAEATSLGLDAGQSFTICGELNPDEQTDDVVDADVFEFRVEVDMVVRLELTSAGGDSLEGFEMSLFAASGPSYLGVGPYLTDYGVITMPLKRGAYWVGVVARKPVPSSAVGYTVEISENNAKCTTPGSPGYSESADDGDSRGNDVVEITHPDVELTADSGDSPEATGITLAPGADVLIEGVSASVSATDDYTDRDAYLISTGASVDELELQLGWADDVDVDLDVYLFGEDDLASDFSTGAGTNIATDGNETFTVAVLPNKNYWLWVGAFKDGGTLPQDYGITLCPRTH